jgi:hypothetical protein
LYSRLWWPEAQDMPLRISSPADTDPLWVSFLAKLIFSYSCANTKISHFFGLWFLFLDFKELYQCYDNELCLLYHWFGVTLPSRTWLVCNHNNCIHANRYVQITTNKIIHFHTRSILHLSMVCSLSFLLY